MLILAKDMKSQYKLYCVDDYAFSQFAGLFKEITDLEIVRTDRIEGKTIVISQEKEGLENDSYRIRTHGENLYLTGTSKRGVLYAIFTFFEEFAGCRWISSDISHIPKKKIFVIDDIDLHREPCFWYRETYYKDTFNPDYALRNKLNGRFSELEDKHGGKIEYGLGFVHTFHTLVPADKYFDEHPEYFPMIDGKREKGPHHQLCLSNPDVLEITIEKVKKAFDTNPNVKIASVSQSDTYHNQGNYCQCPECSAIDELEGSPSGSVLRFVNKVADAIKDDYPDKFIDTLAYRYTRKAPKFTKARDNVIVRLCTIECCFSHSLLRCDQINEDGSSRNGSFLEDLREWGKICNNIFIWDYIVNFLNYLTPYPNFYALQENMQTYAKNNVKGVFSQGCGEVLNSEFSRFRAYVISKLLEDPYCDIDLVISEFLAGYYKMAAPPIERYYHMLNSKAVSDNVHFGLYDNPSKEFLDDKFIDEADRMFDRAEALADDETILFRVQRTRMSLKYAKLFLKEGSKEEKQEALDRYFEEMKEYGLASLLEGGNFDSSYARMKSILNI